MIHKLLKIENVGTFVKVEFNTPNWNGEFKKYNAIYTDNGCGKTTFTQLLKSCKSMRDAQELEERNENHKKERKTHHLRVTLNKLRIISASTLGL